jgi:hypothetical protein
MAASQQNEKATTSQDIPTIRHIEAYKDDIRFPGQRDRKIMYCAPRKLTLPGARSPDPKWKTLFSAALFSVLTINPPLFYISVEPAIQIAFDGFPGTG